MMDELSEKRRQHNVEKSLALLSEKVGIDLTDPEQVAAALEDPERLMPKTRIPGKYPLEYKVDRYRLLVDVMQAQEAHQRLLAANLGVDDLIVWERHDQIVREGAWCDWPVETYHVPIVKETGKMLVDDGDFAALVT